MSPVSDTPTDNHKPSQTSASREAILSPSSDDPDVYNLSVVDDDEDLSTYTYRGRKATKPAPGSCVLVYDPATQAFTLEKLDKDMNFNLTSAPWEDDASKLEKQYAQLELKDADAAADKELLREDDEDMDADSDNPYDYRNWMEDKYKGETRTSTSDSGKEATVQPKPESIEKKAPMAEPKARALSRKEVSKSRPKFKAKARPGPVPRPEQRDDSADDESSDGDVLTIEMDPVTKPKRGLGAHLEPGSNAPRSLHSAASSMSPASKQESSSESDEDEDVDDDVKLPLPVLPREPEPAHAPSPGMQRDEEEDDLEDDLEAELAQALGSEDIKMGGAKSESESEEE